MFAALSKFTGRRVVVTGLGLVDPMGVKFELCWQRLKNGESGIVSTADIWPNSPSKVGGLVPVGEDGFKALDYVTAKDLKRMDKFIIYSMAATTQALDDAGLADVSSLDKDRVGVGIGSGIGGLGTIEDNVIALHKGDRVSPMFIPSALINLASGNVAIKYGFSGPIFANCAACASGLQAIGDAARSIIMGDADVMIAGGGECGVSPIGVAGFAACRALSTGFNATPTRASRPWDKARDGFVIGEGAGVIVLEEYEHAKRRNAKIYAEVVGYGSRADVYHITAPEPGGAGAFKAMQEALHSAAMDPEEVDYVNAHGTSTPAGDEAELLAVAKLYSKRSRTLHMSSVKSAIGHSLGASGSIELIYSVLAMRDGVIPPTLNLDDPIDSLGIDLVPHHSIQQKVRSVMANAFGFGGINVSLILRAI